ncbi:MAG: divalent-cation tolerance protein CutA [Candidatus Hydrothermarchaeaceae archaeon]
MYVLVYITTSDAKEAEHIGENIVKQKLAACANIIKDISSIYWWKGKLEKEGEALLLLKTSEKNVEKVIDAVRKMHSYENPAVVAIPILKGSKDYLSWIDEVLYDEKAG